LSPVFSKFSLPVFHSMNYSFFTPRKDQCDRCLGHKNGLIEETIRLNHVREKDLARNYKEADKKLAIENPHMTKGN